MTKQESKPEPGKRGIGQAFVLFATCLVLVVLIGSTIQAISFAIGLVVTLVVLIALPAILFVAVWHKLPILDGLNSRRIGGLTIVLSLVLGACAWSIAAAIHRFQTVLLGPDWAPDMPLDNTATYLLMLVVGALLPGVCEELLFRGAILGVLRKKGDWFAILISAVLFGAFHMSPWTFLPAVFLGIVLGWVVVRTGSILPGVLVHAANNGTAFTVGFLFRNAEAPPDGLMIGLAIGFVACLVAFVVLIREKAQAPLLLDVNAGLPIWFAWIFGILSGLFVTVVLVIAGLIFMFVRIIEVEDNALQPSIQTGDQLILVVTRDTDELTTGETIGLERDGRFLGRVVSRAEGGRVWIWEGTTEVEVKIDAIRGKMVQILKQSETD